jgi:beta-glucosidase
MHLKFVILGFLAFIGTSACGGKSDSTPPDTPPDTPPEQPFACADPPASGSATGATPIYLDTSFLAEERAADLVSRMTLAEKVSQLNSSQAAAVPALDLPAYGWWNEAAHGVAREQTNDGGNPPTSVNTTSYPVDLALGSTWNPDLIYQEAQLISDEAREVFRENRLDLNIYAPTINLARDPRWGRNDEAFSEDPLLTGALAAQYVNGMEGKDQNGELLPESGGYRKINTTLKHFAANNSEFNRRSGTSDMDDRTLREYYTAQFRGAVARSRPASIMSSYNSINGVPAAASVYLIDTLARETFGFTGFFTSDCDAIREIQAGHHWQPDGYPHPLDNIERHAFALTAGEDLDCDQGYHDDYSYGNTLVDAIARGIVTQAGTVNENDVDISAVRLFAARMRLGEFDNENDVPWVTRARAQVAPGSWTNSDANGAVTETTERLAMARKVADQAIVLLKNSDTTRRDASVGKLLPMAVPASGAFRLAVIGTYASPDTMFLGGYSSDQGPAGVAKQVNGYEGLKAAVQAINPAAVVDFYPGVTPGTLAAVDAASVTAAVDYDYVVVYLGTDDGHSREDVDRTTLALPGAQADLISQVAVQNPNTIVYMETVGQVDVASFEPAVAALLWSSYNGQRKGEALADVLLGAYNPSGRLPFTWYTTLAELPTIDDYRIRPSGATMGRTYMYFQGAITYPFGYGLSYTTFDYASVDIDSPRYDANGTLTLTVGVTNGGSVAGDEVVQVYITTPDAAPSLERPRKRLRGFKKISLAAQQTNNVNFAIPIADLAFFDEASGKYVVDTGMYQVQIARSASAADVLAEAEFAVTGALAPVPTVVTVKPRAQGDAEMGIVRRVFFPTGTVIDPQITVAMSDDSLYGYVAANASRPLPDGVTVQYRSNRPDVVSVDSAGVLRTLANGVATVRACVVQGDATASVDFVTYVK